MGKKTRKPAPVEGRDYAFARIETCWVICRGKALRFATYTNYEPCLSGHGRKCYNGPLEYIARIPDDSPRRLGRRCVAFTREIEEWYMSLPMLEWQLPVGPEGVESMRGPKGWLP